MATRGRISLTRHRRYAEASEALRGGEELLRGVPFTGRIEFGSSRHAATRRSQRARAAADLHRLCERRGPLYDAEFVSVAHDA